MFTRRALLGAGGIVAVGGLSGCTSLFSNSARTASLAPAPVIPAYPAFYGPMPDERFPIPAVPAGVVPPVYWRQQVADPTGEIPGTIVVDPNAFFLHLVQEGGTAMRYGIGVGRQGFEWAGDAVVKYKKAWPTWTPPTEMIERQPELEPYSAANGGQDPGLTNPLGARALYLFQGGRDTLYRIHGSPEARSIGKAVSSGCIRLLNQDIIDLHSRVADGSKVVVRTSSKPAALT